MVGISEEGKEKKYKVGGVLLRKVKGQELVMKGSSLIKSKVKNKVSYLVDLLFSNQNGLM
jgi:hypothetical protein